MAHRAQHLQLQASSLVLPLSTPADRSRLNAAYQVPIRSTYYGFTKDTKPTRHTPCFRAHGAKSVSGMETG